MALQSNNSFHMWQKKNPKNPLDNSRDSSSVKLHHRQSQPCNAPLWREPLLFLFRRPPDAPLLVLKTQPSLRLCHSCMRSCILRSWASQAHTCPAETTSLKQQREKKQKKLHDLWNIWILKLFAEPKAAVYQPTINDCPNSGGRPEGPVFCPVMFTPATGDQMSNIFVLLRFFQSRSDRRGFVFTWKGDSHLLYVFCVHCKHMLCTQSVSCGASESLSRVYLQQTCGRARASTAQRAETRGLTSTSHFRRARSHLSLLVMLLKLNPTRERHVCFLLQSGKMCSAGELTGPLPV